MSWTVNLIENTVSVDPSAQEKLLKLNDYLFEYPSYRGIDKRGKLNFNVGDMEHIDYLWDEEIRNLLVDHHASGRVLFGDLDGDNFGTFWGYEFSDNKCTLLKGTLVWTEE